MNNVLKFLEEYYKTCSAALGESYAKRSIEYMVNDGKIDKSDKNDFFTIISKRKEIEKLRQDLGNSGYTLPQVLEKIRELENDIDVITGDDILKIKRKIKEKEMVEEARRQQVSDPCSSGYSGRSFGGC